jgi:hypothetical protein
MTLKFRPLLGAAAVFAAFGLPMAHASTLIDFEPGDLTGLYLPGDTFSQAGFTLSTKFDFGIVDVASALGGSSPVGNATQFYFNGNDGRLGLASSDASLFSLDGFSAAFVPLDPASAQLTVIVATGIKADNSTVTAWWSFAPSATSHYPFASYAAPADFAAFSGLKSVEFRACSRVGNLICTQPTQNNGQFAIDNILVSAVPEPTAALLLSLGLVGTAGLARRARRAAR